MSTIYINFHYIDINEATDDTLLSPYLDANCIQILAPKIACEDNIVGGFYAPGEHIGHLSRHFASLISPFFDESKYSSCEIHCHLLYNDSNHSRAGYAVDVVIISTLTPQENDLLFISLEAENLNPRR